MSLEFKRTDELKPGDVVRVNSYIVRTVDRVVPTGYISYSNEQIHNVMYRETASDEWSDGNSAAPSSVWEVLA
jgi:hypothetical protein